MSFLTRLPFSVQVIFGCCFLILLYLVLVAFRPLNWGALPFPFFVLFIGGMVYAAFSVAVVVWEIWQRLTGKGGKHN